MIVDATWCWLMIVDNWVFVFIFSNITLHPRRPALNCRAQDIFDRIATEAKLIDRSDGSVQPMTPWILPRKMGSSPEMMQNYRGKPWKPMESHGNTTGLTGEFCHWDLEKWSPRYPSRYSHPKEMDNLRSWKYGENMGKHPLQRSGNTNLF